IVTTPVLPELAQAGSEPVLEARLPADAINYTVRRLLVNRTSAVKRFDDIVLSPITGAITVSGQIELPAGIVHSLEEQTSASSDEIMRLHDFQFSFTPKILNLRRNSYL